MTIRALLLDGDGVCQHAPFGWTAGVLRRTGARDWAEIATIEGPLMVGGDVASRYETGFPNRTVEVSEILDYWNLTVVDAAALELIDRVRERGVSVHLASNQQPVRAAAMRDLPYRAHLDGFFFSCDLGLAKPDPEFFRAIVARLGCAPAETLFVDDIAANVEGARAAGLVAEQLQQDQAAPGLAKILRTHGLIA